MAEQRGTVGGPVLTEWFAKADLHTLDVYESLGGYSALRKGGTEMSAVQVIGEVKASGLRGRGGADFPTAMKWSFVPKDHPGPKYIVVNADESEPGSAKDRYLMENSPHALVEGAAIASYAIGGHQAWIYIRGEYDLPYEMLRDAIAEAHAKGYLGDHPFGTDHALDVRLYRRPGAYICREESARGVAYREIMEARGGGVRPGRRLKVFGPGGSSAKVLPASMLDTSTDLDGLKALGTMGGSGGIIVMDDSHCVVKAAARLLRFYAFESCGKCTPCRVGGNWAVRTYERILSGEGSQIELGILERVSEGLQNGRCLCGLGDAAGWVIESTMRHFHNEYEEHSLHNFCSVEAALVHA